MGNLHLKAVKFNLMLYEAGGVRFDTRSGIKQVDVRVLIPEVILRVPFHRFKGKTRSKTLNNFIFFKLRQFGFHGLEYLHCSC